MSAAKMDRQAESFSPALLEDGSGERPFRQKERFEKLARPLLDWYDRCKRDLPWRMNTDPYRVWISEIMLQQTRVEAVKEGYTRFLEALPDLKSLAEADEERLMKLWEGMGYYSRARNLQKAARIAVEKWGRLPEDPEDLRSLPGIGEYTAGAVASIAFGKAVPAVDGNVLRVLSRYAASFEDVGKPAVKKEVEQTVRKWIPKDRPGDFNQALMDLGATVCIPGAPRCLECPLRELCRGFSLGVSQELPVKGGKKARRKEEKTILLLVDPKGRLALEKRNQRGLLAGMWQLPNLEGFCSQEEAGAYLAEKGLLREGRADVLPSSSHIFSHVEWHMRGFRFFVKEPEGSFEENEGLSGFYWCTRQELDTEKALPAAFRAYTDWFRSRTEESRNG